MSFTWNAGAKTLKRGATWVVTAGGSSTEEKNRIAYSEALKSHHESEELFRIKKRDLEIKTEDLGIRSSE